MCVRRAQHNKQIMFYAKINVFRFLVFILFFFYLFCTFAFMWNVGGTWEWYQPQLLQNTITSIYGTCQRETFSNLQVCEIKTEIETISLRYPFPNEHTLPRNQLEYTKPNTIDADNEIFGTECCLLEARWRREAERRGGGGERERQREAEKSREVDARQFSVLVDTDGNNSTMQNKQTRWRFIKWVREMWREEQNDVACTHTLSTTKKVNER